VARLYRLAVIAVGVITALAGPLVSHADSEYVVQHGDTLFGIASRSGVRLPDLLRANDLTVTSVIQPGQQLTIPAGTASPAPAASSGAATYTVKPGDWLSRIADRHGVTLSALLAANNLTATSLIQPGQQLTIPGATASPAPAASAGGPTYTVQQGDALSAIAARHRVTLAALLELNNLTATSVIQPGQQLTLPRGAVAAPTTGTGIDRVISYALAQLGKPYRFFTAGPYTFDCSGLTLAAYSQIGVRLVHHSASQAGQGIAVNFWSEPIRPGDLIFLATRGSSTINHVGMAVSATTWIQARRPGDVVRLAPLPPKGIIMAVRRFVPAG
jgi:LysM repeat protein